MFDSASTHICVPVRSRGPYALLLICALLPHCPQAKDLGLWVPGGQASPRTPRKNSGHLNHDDNSDGEAGSRGNASDAEEAAPGNGSGSDAEAVDGKSVNSDASQVRTHGWVACSWPLHDGRPAQAAWCWPLHDGRPAQPPPPPAPPTPLPLCLRLLSMRQAST